MTHEKNPQKLDVEFPGLYKLSQEIYYRHGDLLHDYTRDCASQGLSIWQLCQIHGEHDSDYWIGLTESEDTWHLVPDYVRIFNEILPPSVEGFTGCFYGYVSSITPI